MALLSYILKRIGYAALTVFFLMVLTFLMMQLLPGNPFLGDKAISQVTMDALYAKYGLDKPLWEQFLIYMNNFLHGDLGLSIKYNRPVNTIIADSFPYSAELGIRALVFAACFGVGLGVIAAIKRNTGWDSAAITLAVIGVSIPSFIMGALLQYLFAVKFRAWFGFGLPTMGWKGEATKILPTLALCFGTMATVARLTRTSMLDVLGQDYIKTARAKGLTDSEIVGRHALRNAILPVVTILGPTAATLLTGTFVVESIFNIPGLGQFFVKSIRENDYTMIAGTTVFYGIFLVAATLVVDILYGFIDPRIKLTGSRRES
jgi:oligopeptide transport system permease protein